MPRLTPTCAPVTAAGVLLPAMKNDGRLCSTHLIAHIVIVSCQRNKLLQHNVMLMAAV